MRKIRVGINGLGRIGRNVYREHFSRENIEIVVINDIVPPPTLVHLLKYDSILGRFNKEIKLEGNTLYIGDRKTEFICEKELSKIPWGKYEIDIVLESSGVFTKRAYLEEHLKGGAKKVLLSAPAKDKVDITVVLGVNDHLLNKEHKIISNASCTTNCLAPVAYVLHKNFEIESGFMNTAHAYTNDQRILDLAHSDLRRARAGAINIIPTTTGAAKAIGLVIPELEGKLDGLAVRVPVPNGSMLDLTCIVKKSTNVSEINNTFVEASKTYLKGILEASFEPLVSTDILGTTYSAIVDCLSTMVLNNGKLIKVLAWYDNEKAYSLRLLDIIERIGKLIYE